MLYESQEKYLSLETYRKNGTAVATPVWFAISPDGTIYVYPRPMLPRCGGRGNNPKGRIATLRYARQAEG